MKSRQNEVTCTLCAMFILARLANKDKCASGDKTGSVAFCDSSKAQQPAGEGVV